MTTNTNTRHTTEHPRRSTPGCEAGSVTLFLVITVVGLFTLVGLVVDGGARLHGVQQADALAAEAGRAAGQVIDRPDAITGATPRVNTAAAVAAAQAFLAGHDVTGTVTVTGQGRSLDIIVTGHTSTVFLGLIGITTLSTSGHATVTLVRTVAGVPT